MARLSRIIERRGRNEDTSIIAYWTTTTIPSAHGLLRDRDFQMWIDWLVRDGQLVAGHMAPADLYTNQLQPAAVGQR